MADINYQTDQIFDEKSAQQKIADDEYYKDSKKNLQSKIK